MRTFDSTPDGPGRDRIRVGVSQYVVVEGGETLYAYGLGSTVAVSLFDTERSAGSLANAVLPRRRDGQGSDPAKFVDSATQAMVKELAEGGSTLRNLQATVVGGAELIELDDLATGVGPENVRAAREELGGLAVPVVGEAVGGDRGRVVEFDTETGEVTVETLDHDSPERIV